MMENGGDRLTLYDSNQGEEPVLAGSISVPGTTGGPSDSGAEFNTLDEPISQTVKRDLSAVGSKFFHVLYPVEKKSLLREWDLWGPLILCTFMAIVLQGHEPTNGTGDGGPQFAEVFVIVWVGSLIVTVNTKMLGGNISFFQSVCVLGYCLLPLALALLTCSVLLFFSPDSTLVRILRGVSALIGFAWSTYASVQFLGDSSPPNKKMMCMYPMLLFYLVIGWMVMSHSA